MLLLIEGFWVKEADLLSAAHCQSSSVERIADFLLMVFMLLDAEVCLVKEAEFGLAHGRPPGSRAPGRE